MASCALLTGLRSEESCSARWGPANVIQCSSVDPPLDPYRTAVGTAARRKLGNLALESVRAIVAAAAAGEATSSAAGAEADAGDSATVLDLTGDREFLTRETAEDALAAMFADGSVLKKVPPQPCPGSCAPAAMRAQLALWRERCPGNCDGRGWGLECGGHGSGHEFIYVTLSRGLR